MNSSAKLAVALGLGAAIGGVALHQLHAQAKPPVDVVIDIAEIVDAQSQRVNTERPIAHDSTGWKISRSRGQNHSPGWNAPCTVNSYRF